MHELLMALITNTGQGFAWMVVFLIAGLTVGYVSRNIRRNISESQRMDHERKMAEQRRLVLENTKGIDHKPARGGVTSHNDPNYG